MLNKLTLSDRQYDLLLQVPEWLSRMDSSLVHNLQVTAFPNSLPLRPRSSGRPMMFVFPCHQLHQLRLRELS